MQKSNSTFTKVTFKKINMNELILKIKIKLIEKSIIILDKTKGVGKVFKREAHETRVASKILMKIIKGKDVTPEEIKYLKDQSADLGKALTVIGLQAVPGSSLAIVAIEAVGRKHGFTLFPKEQVEPGQEKTDASEQISPSELQNRASNSEQKEN